MTTGFLHRFRAEWGLPEDPPFDPAGLEVRDGVAIFHYADPDIAETVWGVALHTVHLPDPPVLIDIGEGWAPYAGRLSLARADLALTAILDRDRFGNAAELPPEHAGAVAAAFERVPLPDLPMWIGSEESPVRWYHGPGQLLRTHGDDWMWLWVEAASPERLAAVYAALPDADWCS